LANPIPTNGVAPTIGPTNTREKIMQTLVAVYPSRAQAEDAKAKLIDFGIPANKIGLSPESTGGHDPVRADHRPSGFWDWLFGSDVDDHDREMYSTALSGGRTAVCAYLPDEQQRSEVERVLHDCGAVDLSASGAGAQAETGRQASTERIPIVKEELEVGKRQTEQRYHVRVHPVERAVQEQVNLRDERVVIERRPTEGYSPTDKDLAPREFEVVERHEEPVVAKTARATEEVVVRRDVTERTETVRDTVKETKVEVDRP
jgi:stress response protein YsnF